MRVRQPSVAWLKWLDLRNRDEDSRVGVRSCDCNRSR
jgi:hypothetical protein